MKRLIEVIPTETLDALRRYPWPGNVRELENLIERAVILSSGPQLNVMRVLEETSWMLGGPRGAAALLGTKRQSLQSLMTARGAAAQAPTARSHRLGRYAFPPHRRRPTSANEPSFIENTCQQRSRQNDAPVAFGRRTRFADESCRGIGIVSSARHVTAARGGSSRRRSIFRLELHWGTRLACGSGGD